MSLTVSTSNNAATEQEVARSEVQQIARDMGAPNADRAIGVTRPSIRTDTTRLEFERGSPPDHAGQARFLQGTLTLTLSQTVFLANDLNDCEKRVLRTHEAEHVGDNEQIMRTIETSLRADARFSEILVDRVWFPASQFSQIQADIRARVAAVFRSLTSAAVANRDTQAAYAQLETDLRACRPEGR